MVEKDVIAARLEEGDAGRSVMSRYLNLKHQMIGFATATVVLVCASLWFVEDEHDAMRVLIVCAFGAPIIGFGLTVIRAWQERDIDESPASIESKNLESGNAIRRRRRGRARGKR